MAVCPFYRVQQIVIERRRKRRDEDAVKAPRPAPWCAHLYSPVTKYVATVIVGGSNKLRCGGDLDKCQVPPTRRPKL
jgi:hypothetical protein